MSEVKSEALVQAENLANLIMSGQASEKDKGLVLRTIQIGMASSMVAQLNSMHAVTAKAMSLYNRLDEEFMRQTEELLEAGTLTREELRLERNSIESRIMAILNLERQIVQGKNIFPEDSLSEEDRKVLRLMSSIKTPEEKAKFFKALDNFFQEKNSFEEPVDEE